MTWARLDDGYDDHPKVMAATALDPLAAALHPQAITASARRESDGLVDPFWLLAKAPDKRKRTQALETLVRLRMFDVLPAGQAVTLTDGQGFDVTLGPFDEPQHLVHDFLDFNPSSTQLAFGRLEDKLKRELERDKDLTAAIRERDGDRCRYCARKVDWRDRRSDKGATYDHRDLAQGNTPENVIVVCRACKRRKGTRSSVEAGMPVLPPGQMELPRGVETGQNHSAAGPDHLSASAVSFSYPTRPDPTRPQVKVPPLGPPPSGRRKRDWERWRARTLRWARAIGVDGPASTIGQAIEHAEPWTQPEPVAHFRGYVARCFAEALTVTPPATEQELALAPRMPFRLVGRKAAG